MAVVHDDGDDADFLGKDEIQMVSDSLHDWTFDQIVVLGMPATPSDERTLVNWHCPDPQRITRVLRHAASLYDISFSMATQIGCVHGFSIMQHKFKDTISLLQNLDSAAVLNDTGQYFDHLVYKPVISMNTRRLAVRIDTQTAEAMGNIAAVLGTSRSHLAGMCILMSVSTSDLLEPVAKAPLQKYIDHFSKGIELYEKMAASLI